MKKLLFTLCAVLAGFAANAQQHALTLQYVDAEGTVIEKSELIVKPGTQTVVYVQVAEMTGYNAVDGFQVQWPIKNVEGAAYDANGAVHLLNYGTNIKKSYFKAGSLCLDGTTFTNGINGDNYRIIATNGEYGCTFGNAEGLAARFEASVADVEGSFDAVNYTIPGNIIEFTVVTSADWDEEYATMDFDEEYCKFSWHGAPEGSKANGNLDLKIINENKLPKDLAGDVEFTVDEATGAVTAQYVPGEGDPENVTVTFKVDGEDVTLPYQLTSGAAPITIDWTASAEGYNDLPGSSDPLSWTAPTPDMTDAPEITFTAENGTLTVTATGEGTVILNGPNNVSVTGNGTATAEVTYDPYVGYNDTWTATAQAEGELVSDPAASKTITVEALPAPEVATPVITFAETKDGEVVTAVTVQIENWTSATINGEEFTNTRGDVKTFTANYTADQEIHVEAVNDPAIANHPEFAKDAEDDYTLKKLEKKAVAAPEVTSTTGDDAVTLNITWPESDGTHVIKVDGQESTQTSFPRQDEAYDVELDIYVTEGPTSAESAHYTQTITIPAKEPVTPTEETGQPAFNPWTTKPNQNAEFITIDNAETEPNATIYYRIINPDGSIQGATEENPEGWQVYTGEIGIYGANQGGMDGNYRIEAYAQAPGKLPSKVIAIEEYIDEETSVNELIAGKTVANVRYFNMAGQEMQEANGMTIVVTTYTDGTTSAIKVMK